MAISADGQRVYAAGYGEVTVWSTAAGQLLMRIPVAGIQIADIELTSSSNLLAVSSGTPGEIGVVQLIDATNGKPAGDVWRGNDLPADVAFSHQGDRLLVGLMDGSLHMYRTEDRQPIYQLTPHADAILAVAWSPDDERIVTCARDRTAKHYNAADGQLLSSYDRHERAVGGVAYTSAGPFSLDETGLLRLWNKDNDSAIAENGGNLRFLQHLTTVEDRLIVPALGSLRKLQIIRKEIDDGKDDKGEPKKKKVTRFEGLGSLASQDPQSFILSVSANQHGDIVAGTDLGQVIYWKIDSEQPISAFLAKP